MHVYAYMYIHTCVCVSAVLTVTAQSRENDLMLGQTSTESFTACDCVCRGQHSTQYRNCSHEPTCSILCTSDMHVLVTCILSHMVVLYSLWLLWTLFIWHTEIMATIIPCTTPFVGKTIIKHPFDSLFNHSHTHTHARTLVHSQPKNTRRNSSRTHTSTFVRATDRTW